MKTVSIYTDGACSGNPGPGGWAAILRYGIYEKMTYGGEVETTNNRMELMAVKMGLYALKQACIVELYTDSQYIARAINEGWLEDWRRRGWRRKEGELKNADLWRQIWELSQKHELRCTWVRGHADNVHNNRCDKLAVTQRDRLAAAKQIQDRKIKAAEGRRQCGFSGE